MLQMNSNGSGSNRAAKQFESICLRRWSGKEKMKIICKLTHKFR